jgi:Fis family transcriptional regulator, factor for inversion stimulation protein
VNVRRELDSLVTQMHSSGIRYEDAVREFKRQYLREVLVAHRGNQCKAAEELGMHRNTLSRTMAELGLDLAEVRAGLKRPPRSERPVFSAARQSTARADILPEDMLTTHRPTKRASPSSRALPGTRRTLICSTSTARCCAAATASTSILSSSVQRVTGFESRWPASCCTAARIRRFCARPAARRAFPPRFWSRA